MFSTLAGDQPSGSPPRRTYIAVRGRSPTAATPPPPAPSTLQFPPKHLVGRWGQRARSVLPEVRCGIAPLEHGDAPVWITHTQGCLSFAAQMFEAACLTLRVPELHPRRVEDALHLPHAGWENIAQSAQTRRVPYGQYVPSPSSPLRCGGCMSPEPRQHRLAKASATGEAMNDVNRRVQM